MLCAAALSVRLDFWKDAVELDAEAECPRSWPSSVDDQGVRVDEQPLYWRCGGLDGLPLQSNFTVSVWHHAMVMHGREALYYALSVVRPWDGERLRPGQLDQDARCALWRWAMATEGTSGRCGPQGDRKRVPSPLCPLHILLLLLLLLLLRSISSALAAWSRQEDGLEGLALAVQYSTALWYFTTCALELVLVFFLHKPILSDRSASASQDSTSDRDGSAHYSNRCEAVILVT